LVGGREELTTMGNNRKSRSDGKATNDGKSAGSESFDLQKR
jgi:hypothetical protein